jgi:hypothetical protein
VVALRGRARVIGQSVNIHAEMWAFVQPSRNGRMRRLADHLLVAHGDS